MTKIERLYQSIVLMTSDKSVQESASPAVSIGFQPDWQGKRNEITF